MTKKLAIIFILAAIVMVIAMIYIIFFMPTDQVYDGVLINYSLQRKF